MSIAIQVKSILNIYICIRIKNRHFQRHLLNIIHIVKQCDINCEMTIVNGILFSWFQQLNPCESSEEWCRFQCTVPFVHYSWWVCKTADPAVVNVLKRWQITSNDPFCCLDYALVPVTWRSQTIQWLMRWGWTQWLQCRTRSIEPVVGVLCSLVYIPLVPDAQELEWVHSKDHKAMCSGVMWRK